ncbi:MAG: type II toxin-antitoxin system RatA family toxin [Gammaproteobacteria bacterium]
MERHQAHRRVSFSAPQMFDLVLDVERYPEFVPGYRAAKVLRREANFLEAEQVVTLAGMQGRIVSSATYERPRCIEIQSQDEPFSRLRIEWDFQGIDRGSCEAHLSVFFDLEFSWIESLVDGAVQPFLSRVLATFDQRAESVYGDGRG